MWDNPAAACRDKTASLGRLYSHQPRASGYRGKRRQKKRPAVEPPLEQPFPSLSQTRCGRLMPFGVSQLAYAVMGSDHGLRLLTDDIGNIRGQFEPQGIRICVF